MTGRPTPVTATEVSWREEGGALSILFCLQLNYNGIKLLATVRKRGGGYGNI